MKQACRAIRWRAQKSLCGLAGSDMRSEGWCSLNGLLSLFRENLVQQREIVEVREIRHLAAQEPGIKRGFRRCHQRRTQWIVGDLHPPKSIVQQNVSEGLPGFFLNLLIEELL